MYLQGDLVLVSSPLTFVSVSGSTHLLEEAGSHSNQVAARGMKMQDKVVM